MLLDRLDYVLTHSGSGGSQDWSADFSPSDALRRNFWFCTIDDPSTLAARYRIGVDHIMVEVDYPHADSTWPDTQSLLASRFRDLPAGEVELMTHGNAAALFRHPLPDSSWEAAGA